jgi:hypothetical protein
MMYIASVNMRRNNNLIHSLLSTNENAHLILIQEPWFNRIGTVRRDDTYQGEEVLGGVACPAWEPIHPAVAVGKPPKVMAYVRKNLQNTHNSPASRSYLAWTYARTLLSRYWTSFLITKCGKSSTSTTTKLTIQVSGHY